MEHRNSEYQELDRLTQLERMGISSYSKRELIFRLECQGKHQEARLLIKAITNPYFNSKYANRLFQRYWIMLDLEELNLGAVA